MMKPVRTHIDGAALAVIHAHRDVSFELMRSYIEVGDGCYWTVHAIAWSPDGCHWASAGADDTLRIWDAATHHQLRVYPWNRLRGKVLDIVWSPDSRYIGVLADGGPAHHALAHEVVVLSAGTGEEVYREAQCVGAELAWSVSQPLGSISPRSIAVFLCDPGRTWSRDGRFFLASGDERVGDQSRREPTPAPIPPDKPTCEWSPAGACSGRRITGDTARIVDHASKQTQVRLARGTSLAAWSPICNRIASVHRKTIAVWDVEWRTLLCSYRGHTGWWSQITCLSWAPSGRYIASGDSTGAIHIWRVQERGRPSDPLAAGLAWDCA